MKSKYRIVFLGNQSVGKTTLLSQYVYKQSDQNYHPTIGIDYLTTQTRINNEIIKIQLWDTAGQERFNSIIPNYTRDCFMAVVVYDLTDPRTYDAIRHWVEDLVRINDEEGKVKIVIVGNKKDLMVEKMKEEIRNLQSKFNNNKGDGINVHDRVKNIEGRKDTKLNNEEKKDSSSHSIDEYNINENEVHKKEIIDTQEYVYNEVDMLKQMISDKVEEGKKKAREFNGKFVMTNAMNYDDIKELVSIINELVEKDVKETGNVIDLGEERETIHLQTKRNKKCCF